MGHYRQKDLRACPNNRKSTATRDFGLGLGGEARAYPEWSVMAEPTTPQSKRSVALRVFVETAGWLRCSSVTDRCGYAPSSRLAIRPFPRKQCPFYFSDRL
jgi:hypothetical protein